MTTEREQFEAWWSTIGRALCGNDFSQSWEAWQAARAQPAQAVPKTVNVSSAGSKPDDLFDFSTWLPLLSDAEIAALMPPPDLDGSKARSPNAVRRAMRAVEQAVRAKLGVAVPMTDAQIAEFQEDGVFWQSCKHIVRDIEKFHGIVGKEGA